jgi:hypothetical protein
VSPRMGGSAGVRHPRMRHKTHKKVDTHRLVLDGLGDLERTSRLYSASMDSPEQSLGWFRLSVPHSGFLQAIEARFIIGHLDPVHPTDLRDQDLGRCCAFHGYGARMSVVALVYPPKARSAYDD